MAASSFAFYRGAPAVMAFDLSTTPRSDIIVQASGDAHLSNFGLFASPERTLVFDSNDFDETLPGPWEWDVKRLAVSVLIAARANGFTPAEGRTAMLDHRPRLSRADGALSPGCACSTSGTTGRPPTDIETSGRVEGSRAIRAQRQGRRGPRSTRSSRKARSQGPDEGDGLADRRRRRPVADRRRPAGRRPMSRCPGGAGRPGEDVQRLPVDPRREPARAHRALSASSTVALKVVGVGSVGTRCFVILLEGRDEGDPLILQAKEATASVLDPYLESSHHSNHGERVVVGQRLMQATPDIFLGWTRGPGGRDFYFRQLWDMKGSVDIAHPAPPGLGVLRRVCAPGRWLEPTRGAGTRWRSRPTSGTCDTFDGAIADFSEAYADQNDKRLRRVQGGDRRRRDRVGSRLTGGLPSALARVERGTQGRDLRPLTGHFGPEAG